MAIVLRIVSADGKQVIMKSLPGLPSHLKVPAGARVEVIEDKHTMSLAQYVNEHANRESRDETLNSTKIVIDPAGSWGEAEAWLDTLASAPADDASAHWFSNADDDGGARVAGFDATALLIGGVVAAGAGFGVYELTRSSKPKDEVAPAAPTALDLATDDDTGSSTTDNTTNKTTALTITGTAEAGSEVELFSGSTSIGTVTANAQGVFTKDVDLAAGVHSIVARATDAAGNVGAISTALRITVDSTVPAAPTALDLDAEDDTGTSNSDNVTGKTTSLTITGKAEASATIELFDGATSLGTVAAGTDGTFTKDISLASGLHNITVKATDLAGNVGPASEPLQITVDGTPPSAPLSLDLATDDDTGISNSDNITNKTTGLTISGTAEAGSSVQLLAGTATLGIVTADATGVFHLDNVSLAPGSTYSVTAKATDADGNVGPVSTVLSITVDNSAPVAPTGLDLASDDDNGASNSDNTTSKTSGLTISGSAEGGSTVELFDGNTSLGTATVAANGTFSKDISLALGEHHITAKATDVAGNTGAASTELDLTIIAGVQSLAAEDNSAAFHLTSLDHSALLDSSGSFG